MTQIERANEQFGSLEAHRFWCVFMLAAWFAFMVFDTEHEEPMREWARRQTETTRGPAS